MYKFQDGKLYSGSRLAAEVRLEVFNPHGSKIGSLRGRYIYDQHGHQIGTIRGEGIYDENHERISTLKDLEREIGSKGDSTLAALWLLLVR